MTTQIIREEKYGKIPSFWVARARELIVQRVEDHRNTTVCVPWQEIRLRRQQHGPLAISEAVKDYEFGHYKEEGRCTYHPDHYREPRKVQRPILSRDSNILEVISGHLVGVTDYWLSDSEGEEQELVGVELQPYGKGGYSLEFGCVLREKYHLSLYKAIIHSQTEEITLKQRCLAVVAETVSDQQPRLVRGSATRGRLEQRPNQRGLFTDPQVTARLDSLPLPGEVKRELEEQVCGGRPRCSYYPEPVGDHSWERTPDWVLEYFSGGERGREPGEEEDEREPIFLAQPVREEEIITV